MVITSYADLYPLMAPELPGCPEDFMLQALRKSTRKFCQDSDAWRKQLASINLVADKLDYVLSAGVEAEIKHIIEVRINTAAGITSGDIGVLIIPSLYTYHAEATIRLGVVQAAGTLSLDDSLKPAAAVTGGLEVKVSVVPLMNSAVIDMDFLTRWAEAIISGTIFSLMTMKGRKWTDLQRAPLFLLDYNRGVGRARRENVGGQKVDTEGLSA